MSTGLQLGAPGVVRSSEPRGTAFRSVRQDVAGFVGVAPRGPVDRPLPVQSWSEYLRRFGGFEGPGLLPYAVRAFFAQGGARAYVVRVGAGSRGRDRPGRQEVPEPGTARHQLLLADRDGPRAIEIARA